jgi:hypothetical protein
MSIKFRINELLEKSFNSFYINTSRKTVKNNRPYCVSP